jgi:hypothetical protein
VRLDEFLHGLTAMNTGIVGKTLRVFGLAIRKIILKPRESALSVRRALWVVLISVLARLTSLPRVQQIVSFKMRSTAMSLIPTSGTPWSRDRPVDSICSCFDEAAGNALVLHRFLHSVES